MANIEKYTATQFRKLALLAIKGVGEFYRGIPPETVKRIALKFDVNLEGKKYKKMLEWVCRTAAKLTKGECSDRINAVLKNNKPDGR